MERESEGGAVGKEARRNNDGNSNVFEERGGRRKSRDII